MDNHLHNKLRGDSQLPPELEWKHVEDNILSQVDIKSKKDDRVLGFYFYLIPVLLTLGLIVSVYMLKNESENKSSNKNKIASTLSDSEVSKTNYTEELVIAAPKITFDYDQYLREIGTSEDSKIRLSSNSKKTTQDMIPDSKADRMSMSMRSSNTTSSLNTVLSDTGLSVANSKNNPVSNGKSSQISERESLTPQLAFTNLSPILFFPISKDQRSVNAQNKISPTEPLSKSRSDLARRMAIEISADGNYFIPNFTGSDFAEDKSSLDQGIINYGASASFVYKLNNKWAITSGLSYQKYSSRFNYNSETDTMISRPTIIRHRNVYTGDVTSATYNLSGTAVKSREVLHYNQYETLSIPLLISRYWSNKKTYLSLGTGVRYNMLFGAAGKTLSLTSEQEQTAEIISFNEQSYYHNASTVDALIDFSFRYNLGDSFYVGTSISSAMSLNNWTKSSNYSTKPLMLHSSIKFGVWF